jgi:uncharacterized protein YcnI
MLRRVMVGGLVVAGGVLLVAGPAWAHVGVDPESAPKGGDAVVCFAVPNEEDNADTTEVKVQFPSDHPIGVVDVEPLAGWTSSVETQKYATPVKTDDGEVTEGAGVVTWSGGSIKPGQFERFCVSANGLPTDTDSLTFKAIQTYSDGTSVNWIDPTPASGEEPEHPAPVLKLTAAGEEGSSTASDATDSGSKDTAASKDLATSSDVDSVRTVAIAGLVVGAIGLVVALVALFRRPKAA